MSNLKKRNKITKRKKKYNKKQKGGSKDKISKNDMWNPFLDSKINKIRNLLLGDKITELVNCSYCKENSVRHKVLKGLGATTIYYCNSCNNLDAQSLCLSLLSNLLEVLKNFHQTHQPLKLPSLPYLVLHYC